MIYRLFERSNYAVKGSFSSFTCHFFKKSQCTIPQTTKLRESRLWTLSFFYNPCLNLLTVFYMFIHIYAYMYKYTYIVCIMWEKGL